MTDIDEYVCTMENFRDTYDELEPLYRQHYTEMTNRLSRQDIEVSPFKPRLDEYFKASSAGYLLTFVLRHEGAAVGYINVYVTQDMHNQDLIAQEDTIFVVKRHRRGVGRKLVLFGLEELKKRGVKRVIVSALTDLRVAKLWGRMGFKELATQMVYTF